MGNQRLHRLISIGLNMNPASLKNKIHNKQ